MALENVVLQGMALEATTLWLWPVVCETLSSWMPLPHSMISKYFPVLLHSVMMSLIAILLIIRVALSHNAYLGLFDCRISTEHSIGFSCPIPTDISFLHYVVALSIWFGVFDVLNEVIHCKSRVNSNRYGLLASYRLITVCNLLIILQRNQFILMAVLMIGLMECTTFMLCLGYFMTEIHQNTRYLRTSCHISFYYSVIGRILMPMLMMMLCVWYRLQYWIESDRLLRRRGYRPNQQNPMNRELQISLLCGALHIMSCIGIIIANVWWTISLKEQTPSIPISLHQTKIKKHQ